MTLPLHAVTAQYTEQRIPQFRGNPLIEALPPTMSEDGLLSALTLMPDFSPGQRQWSSSDRLMMLESLQNFMIPMRNHVELGRALDSMLRSGYVGRAPQTPGHAKIFQSIYAKQVAGQSFSQTANSRTPQISTSLIGISGMGKTTTVNRWCAHIPKVIYHEEHNLFQIPYLHVEMPSDGSSIKGLAHGILQKIDELIPGANYYDQYTRSGRTGADTLMRSVARVMNLHLVGLLICDEVQNLANATKGGQTVMTELVSACNDLKVPILFIGTNKAAKVLSMDFRQSRRASGHGIAPWDRLYPGTAGQTSEWDDFLDVLWQFQWLRNPVPLDPVFSHYMYECTQGVIDLAIKLFTSAQARAMLDGTETLTADLLLDVFDAEFKLMHPMVEALRSDNLEILSQYDDIAPLNLQQHLENANRKLNLMKSPLFSVKADDETFTPRLAAGLTAMGFDPEESTQVADEIAQKDPTASLAQGVKSAVASLSTPKPVKRQKRGKTAEPLAADLFDERPADYRRAIAHASAESTTVLEQLKKLGMAPNLEEVISL